MAYQYISVQSYRNQGEAREAGVSDSGRGVAHLRLDHILPEFPLYDYDIFCRNLKFIFENKNPPAEAGGFISILFLFSLYD